MKLVSLTLAALLPCTSALSGQSVLQEDAPKQTRKVAIIGAGAGGSSTAYHLSRFAAGSGIDFDITVFERNDYIGGRSTTVSVYNDTRFPVELGASIFVKANKILVDAAKEFELSTSGLKNASVGIPASPALGIWNGQEFILTMKTTGPFGFAKLLWRYGKAPVYTLNLVRAVIDRFLLMYDSPVFPFASLTQAVEDLDLLKVTSVSGEQFLLEHGVTGSFSAEVVQASTRVNYAQNLMYIHGLDTMVSMATEGARAVEGGNWRIFEAMLQASKADVALSTRVQKISLDSDGRYLVDHTSVPMAVLEDGESELTTSVFDHVVIAAPFQFADIELSISNIIPPRGFRYVKLHVTLFASPLLPHPAFFNTTTPVPQTVLTTLPDDEPALWGNRSVGSPGFFSISRLHSVTNPATNQDEYVYKIFSASPPSSQFINTFLGISSPSNLSTSTPRTEDNAASGDRTSPGGVTWLYRKVWDSYPYASPRTWFDKINIGGGLWYTGGMDAFISTMETNALMGKNVAALILETEKWRKSILEAAM